MVTKFQIGDTVELTGDGWDWYHIRGRRYRIFGVDDNGRPCFRGRDGVFFIYNNDKMDYSASLVEEEKPVEALKAKEDGTGEKKFQVDDLVSLTGEAWSCLDMAGEHHRIEGLDKRGYPFFHDDDGKILYIYSNGVEDFSATLVEEAKSAEPKKRLREYTDLKRGDVVVIAGVEFAVSIGDEDVRRISRLKGEEEEEWIYVDMPIVCDMLVDEVRRVKRKVRERVIREVVKDRPYPGETKLMTTGDGVDWVVVEEREVEE